MTLRPDSKVASATETGDQRDTAQHCDVIIVNHHGAADVLGALASLDFATCGVVHVVDNSVAPEQEALLREGIAALHAALDTAHPAGTTAQAGLSPTVRLHISAENLGFGAACNVAFAQSSSSSVLLLNPDARLRPGALQLLQRALARTPQLGAVAPRIDWTQEGDLVMPNLTSQSPAARIAQALACRLAVCWPGAFAARGVRHARKTMRLMGGRGGAIPCPGAVGCGAAAAPRGGAASRRSLRPGVLHVF